ncbi:hypothetical protein GCM10027422_48670 [Hymenobacter arcticus]
MASGTGAYAGQASTAMGAYYRFGPAGQRGTYQLDYDKVVEALTPLYIPQYTGPSSLRDEDYFRLLVSGVQYPAGPTSVVQYPSGVVSKGQFPSGLIFILSPAQAVGGNFSLTDTLALEYEHLDTPSENLRFAASSYNDGVERVLANALAGATGLGYEGAETAGAPPMESGWLLENRPNLIYAPLDTPEVINRGQGKWGALATTAMTIHRYGDPDPQANSPLTRPSATVEMWEGGGGYQQGVFRPAHDCLMGQRIGTGSLLKAGLHDFCPVCRLNLEKTITGHYSGKQVADFPTLDKQRSEYNKVTWATTDTYCGKNPAPDSFSIGPNDKAFNGSRFYGDKREAFWTYTCQLAGGFQLTDLVVRQSLYYPANHIPTPSLRTDYRDVFSSISFQDLTAVFSDAPGDSYTFDVAKFIKEGKYTLNVSRNGAVGLDGFYQTGIQLIIKVENAGPTIPHLELQLSVVLRGPASDFDPGGVPIALKVYPQIQFCWSKSQPQERPVLHFTGTVRAEANPKHFHYADPSGDPDGMGMAGMNMDMGMEMVMPTFKDGDSRFYSHTLLADASCFADSNTDCAGNMFDFTHRSLLERRDAEIAADLPGAYLALEADTFKDFVPDFLNRWAKRVADGVDNAFPDIDQLVPGPHAADAKAKPNWATVFDYYLPGVVNNTTRPNHEFVAVYSTTVAPGQASPRQLTTRKMYVQHQVQDTPAVTSTQLFITKVPRQGAYDNVHINGNMGKHVGFKDVADNQAEKLTHYDSTDYSPTNIYPAQFHVSAIADRDVVAAPFCGTDCFHLHWRWSLLSESIAHTPLLRYAYNISPESYRGWNKTKSHSQVGASLIPPNQQLNIRFEALTAPTKTKHMKLKGDPDNGPEERKVLEYKVRIDAPAPDENQVVLEQGMGWAMIYSKSLTVVLAEASTLAAPPMPIANITPALFDFPDLVLPDRGLNHFGMFDKVYDFIRFHHTYDGTDSRLNLLTKSFTIHNYVQVPEGGDLPATTWPDDSNDPLLHMYRTSGRLVTVVDQALFPDLFTGADGPVSIADM